MQPGAGAGGDMTEFEAGGVQVRTIALQDLDRHGRVRCDDGEPVPDGVVEVTCSAGAFQENPFGGLGTGSPAAVNALWGPWRGCSHSRLGVGRALAPQGYLSGEQEVGAVDPSGSGSQVGLDTPPPYPRGMAEQE